MWAEIILQNDIAKRPIFKSYAFTFRKLCFCRVKAMLLEAKSIAFKTHFLCIRFSTDYKFHFRSVENLHSRYFFVREIPQKCLFYCRLLIPPTRSSFSMLYSAFFTLAFSFPKRQVTERENERARFHVV